MLRVNRVYPGQGRHDPHDVWSRIYRNIPVGSAQSAGALAEIRAGFANATEEAMKLAITFLADGVN